jgi:aspartyl-tRNA(Asn)/glutamyl-tRNA(Gln) amidotransferase subunit C
MPIVSEKHISVNTAHLRVITNLPEYEPSQEVFSARIDDTLSLDNLASIVSISQWRRIAHLARIAVTDDEMIQLHRELNSILSFVEQLAEVDVADVEPMTSVIPTEMKKRADVVTDGGIPDEIVKNAPATEDHFFVVPKVVE